jgi:hypothetical protein
LKTFQPITITPSFLSIFLSLSEKESGTWDQTARFEQNQVTELKVEQEVGVVVHNWDL